jgi:hypothetical protein
MTRRSGRRASSTWRGWGSTAVTSPSPGSARARQGGGRGGAGNWDVAAGHAQEAYDIDVESGWLLGVGHMLFPKALVAALGGEWTRRVRTRRKGFANPCATRTPSTRAATGPCSGSWSSPCRTRPRRWNDSSRCWRSWRRWVPGARRHPVRPGRHRGPGLPGQAGRGRSAARASGAAGTNPGPAVGHRHRRRGRGLLSAARGDLPAARRCGRGGRATTSPASAVPCRPRPASSPPPSNGSPSWWGREEESRGRRHP